MLELGPNGLEVGEHWLPLKSKPTRADRSSQDSRSPPSFFYQLPFSPSLSIPLSIQLSFTLSLPSIFLPLQVCPLSPCLCTHGFVDYSYFNFSSISSLVLSYPHPQLFQQLCFSASLIFISLCVSIHHPTLFILYQSLSQGCLLLPICSRLWVFSFLGCLWTRIGFLR